jgi:hypothetical protein
MNPDQTTGQRVYSLTLVRTQHQIVLIGATGPGAAEATALKLAADPDLVPTVELTPSRWLSEPAMVSGVVTDVTDAWAAGVAMVTAREAARAATQGSGS